MKSLFLVGLCLAVISVALCARDPDRQSLRRKVALACIKETKVRYSTIKKYKAGDFSDDSSKAKCFLNCFAKKLGMFGSDPESVDIDEQYIFTYLDDIIIDKSQIPVIVNKCKASDRGDNSCDYAYNAYLCFYGETHDKPNLVDNSETTFDAVLNTKFESKFGFGLEDGDEELLDTPADETVNETVEKE